MSDPTTSNDTETLAAAENVLQYLRGYGSLPLPPVGLIVNTLRHALAARDAAVRAEAVAGVLAVHWRYFDEDGEPGYDDTTPEPEDVWRYDRDFRAALPGHEEGT